MVRRKKKLSTAVSAMASVPAASDQSAAPSFFEKLPPEIRNAIYELSYTPDTPLIVKPTRPTRTVRRDVSFEHSSTEICILNRLMVSNQWFQEVVKIFASCTTFQFISFTDMVKVVRSLPPYLQLHITTIRVSYGQRADNKVTKSDFKALSKSLPHLRSFWVTGGGYISCFKATDLSVTRDIDNMKRLNPWIPLVQTLRGLSDFKYGLHDDEDLWLDDIAQPIHARGVAVLEEWMRLEVTKAKDT